MRKKLSMKINWISLPYLRMTVLVQARRLSGNGGGKTRRGINLCVLLDILLASKMSVSCSADLLRRPKRKHAAMAFSEMTACSEMTALNSQQLRTCFCGLCDVIATCCHAGTYGIKQLRTDLRVFVFLCMCVLLCVCVVRGVVLCGCVSVVVLWWCFCVCVMVFFCFSGHVFTEELCKER